MNPIRRNQPCPCGSGKAYKHCHGILEMPHGGPGSPVPLHPEDRRRRMFAALEAQRAGRVHEAAALYQSVLNDEPGDFDALHMLGVVKYEIGELPQAEALLRRAIVVNPRVASAHANLRLILAAQERSGAEEQLCREVEQMRAMHREDAGSAMSDDVRVIAFYLPQYHPIPENDLWWGAGFTEWTNVRKALPNFVGHEQPHEPAELGYYDLRSADVRARQADLAREFGIHGFCYYAYWFNGKRLLQQPLDEVLASGTPGLPFCVCWANENWTRRWDGLDHDILIGQEYSASDSEAFIRQLLPVLEDPRYIRVDGRPILLVYKVDLIPQARAMADIWRREARRHGLGELYLCAVRTTFRSDPSAFGFDALVEFPPHGFQASRLNGQVEITNPEFRGMVFDYRHQVLQSLDETPSDCTVFRCAMPGWDNTARRQNDGTVFIRSSPDLFEYWLHAIIEQTRRRLPTGRRLVFVNAWNEWGEGCHLEPDRRSGRQYLSAVRNALTRATRDLPPMVALDARREPENLLADYVRDPALQVRQFAPARSVSADASLVSVVVPVYNHAPFLREAIESVFAQTHSAIELIAVDDGSTDESFELLTELATGARCRVVLIRQPHGGAPSALNRGLAIAHGDYVAVLNSDDAFTPTRIETLLAAMHRERAVLAFSGVAFIGAEGALPSVADKLKARIDCIDDYPGLLYSLILGNVAISTGNLIFARALLAATGGFRDLRLCHDWDFVLSASYAGPLAYVPEPLYQYRLHRTNTFAAMRLHATEETETVYRRFFASIEGHPLLADEKERERFLRFAHEHGCRGYFPVPSTWRYRNYAEWVAMYGTLEDARREELRRDIADFARRPLLSILLPTHNSEERWLRRCLDSVRSQLYPTWELCVADDASSEPAVRAVLEEYRTLDPRIKVVYRAQNGHISRATNSALALATGEFVVLLDHDDELAEDALYWVAREIVESPGAVLIYSDEDKISASDIRFEPYFKPDWNPELLRAQNCISHLGALRTDALRGIGGFRSGLEGAQDWDVVLRLSERCEPEAIRHIPRILYHWRAADTSTAQHMNAKPYAAAAQRRVIAEHLTRIGRVAKIDAIVHGTFWRVEYATQPGWRATVLLDGRGSIGLLERTLTTLAGACNPAIESFRVLIDSTEAAQLTRQLASSLEVEFEPVHFPAATGRGVAWNAACNACTSDVIVLVAAGIEGLKPGWCERLIGYVQNADCGVAAPALLRPDGSFHNASILLDPELATVRPFLGKQMDYRWSGARQALAHNVSVPGSEVLAFRRKVHAAIGGFDAYFSDRDLLAADFCLRIHLSGLWNVWTPYVDGEWAGRRASQFAERQADEIGEFLRRWHRRVAHDPAYNVNFANGWRTFELAFPPRNSSAARTAMSAPTAIEKAVVRDHA